MGIQVQGIDHVELFVPSRQQAASWYARTLGLEIVSEHAAWAASPAGPLMISSDQGRTLLALFRGEPEACGPRAAFRRVAFRTDAARFVEFLRQVPELELFDEHGHRLASLEPIDHERSWSLYFCSPWGHRLELTSYDPTAIKAALTRN